MYKKSCISLTFDDGWRSQFVNAVPVLDKYNLKATFYIITRYLSVLHPKYMGREEILQLHDMGHEIGAHTVTHPNLNLKFLWKAGEVDRSIRDLKDVGIQPTSFAYPYGKYNFYVKGVVRKAGFDNARAVKNQYNGDKMNRWSIRGKFVMRNTSLAEVKGWFNDAQLNGYWLVLIFHQVEEDPGPYGCTPEFLEGICQYLSRESINKLPLSESLKFYYGN